VAEPRDPATSERLDALRRSLYRPGSTEADLQRYLEQREAVVPDAPVEPTPPPARPRRRLVLVGVSAGLGLVLIAGLAVTAGRTAQERVVPTPSATATPAGRRLVVDVGDGQTLAVATGAEIMSTPVPTSMRGTPVVGRLFEGSGNAILPIDAPPDALQAGSAMVLITSNSRVPVAWRALSRLRLGRAISEPLVLGRGISAEPSGAPVPQTFRYAAESWPARIAVAAPPGVRWSLLVAVAGEARMGH
jgi:hypothetical protein